LDVRPFELTEVIEDAIDVFRPAAEAKRIRIHRVLDPAAGPGTGGPGPIPQALWDLLSHPMKFTRQGGAIQAVLQRINSHVEITVSDTGVGIPREFLPHVFERFRQHDSSTTREFAGLGLGLAIVKHIVELHGGTVQAESEGMGKGASFTLRLPV